MTEDLTMIVCGSTDHRCKCQCGQVGGDPKACGHDFHGPMMDMGGGMFSTTCKHCGMSAYSHSMLFDF